MSSRGRASRSHNPAPTPSSLCRAGLASWCRRPLWRCQTRTSCSSCSSTTSSFKRLPCWCYSACMRHTHRCPRRGRPAQPCRRRACLAPALRRQQLQSRRVAALVLQPQQARPRVVQQQQQARPRAAQQQQPARGQPQLARAAQAQGRARAVRRRPRARAVQPQRLTSAAHLLMRPAPPTLVDSSARWAAAAGSRFTSAASTSRHCWVSVREAQSAHQGRKSSLARVQVVQFGRGGLLNPL